MPIDIIKIQGECASLSSDLSSKDDSSCSFKGGGDSVAFMTPKRGYSDQKGLFKSKSLLNKKRLEAKNSTTRLVYDPLEEEGLANKKSSITPRKSSKHRKKGRMLLTHPLSFRSTCDEDMTCDADAEESSDSTHGNLKTTITTAGTSKTSSMSSRTQGNKNITTFLTPPRAFIRSSHVLEFSPLSLSIPSSCNSSIRSESANNDSSLVNSSPNTVQVVEKDTVKKSVPTTLYFRSFRRRVNREDLSELKRSLFDEYTSRFTLNNTERIPLTHKKITCCTSKTLITKCLLWIYLYCVLTFLFSSMHMNRLQFDSGKEHSMDEFTSVSMIGKGNLSVGIAKGNLRRKYLPRKVEKNSPIFQDPNRRITVKRMFGGFYPIFIPNDDVKILPTKKRRRVHFLNKSGGNTTKPGEKFRRKLHPRVFSFYSPTNNHVVREMDVYPTVFSDNTQLYGIRDSGDPALSNMEPIVSDKNSECVPMEEWQTTHHPTCNGIHELSMSEDVVRLVGQNGFSRNAWRVEFHNETVILKTPKYEHNFEQAYYVHDRVDAQAMERLTFSPHVINVYGFCGRAVMSEFANGPRKIGTISDKARKHPLKRLEIARGIANGLYHVHFGHGEGNATMVHLDVNPANIVVVDNTLKFNDFNIAIMLKKNITSGSTCGFPAQFPNPQWRSPEEVNESENLNDKVDVFSMGHIFYRIVCGHEPWNKLELSGRPSSITLKEKVKAGILPHIPDHILHTKNAEEQVIRDAMLACYTVDPNERPGSQDIAEFLNYHYFQLSNGENYTPRT